MQNIKYSPYVRQQMPLLLLVSFSCGCEAKSLQSVSPPYNFMTLQRL